MTRFFRYASCVAMGVICVLFAVGCAMPQASAPEGEDNVEANRQYMSALNQMSDDLEEKLQAFSDAVARNDTVSMRTQADNAFKVIDAMSEADAPEDLEGLKDGYLEACEGLEDALNDYIGLYESVAASSASLSSAEYTERLQGIQEKYDAAVSKLEETDKQATELQK